MDEELRKAICDYFEVGDFAEYIGVTVDDLIEAFPDEVEDALEDIKELMEWEDVEDDND
jgi:hypothetical protein